jgi:hypothetical protein
LEARDALQLPEAHVAAERLAECDRRLNGYAEEVYERAGGGSESPEPASL